MANKMTYVMALDMVLNGEALTDEAREKLIALKAQHQKKNSSERKPTKNQTENEKLKASILTTMEVGTQYTISDMMKTFDCLEGLSNQKISALVRQMVGITINRTEVKGKAYFSLM